MDSYVLFNKCTFFCKDYIKSTLKEEFREVFNYREYRKEVFEKYVKLGKPERLKWNREQYDRLLVDTLVYMFDNIDLEVHNPGQIRQVNHYIKSN